MSSLRDGEGEWFVSSLCRKVGNGECTSFWEDIWVGDSNLRSAFPCLFELSLDKCSSVAEAGGWVDNRWVWSRGFRRELREWEKESLLKLTELLECRKTVPDEADRWLWKPEPSSCFAVKNAYKVLLDRKLEVNYEVKKMCKFIWDNPAVPKVQATAWRVIFHKVATKSELKRMGAFPPQSDAKCPLCHGCDETVEHLFVECSRVWTLWSSCVEWIGMQSTLNNNISMNFMQFCYLAEKRNNRRLLAALWSCAVWLIWKNRNDIVFNYGE